MVLVRGLPGVLRLQLVIGNRYFFVGGGALFKRRTPIFWPFHMAAPMPPVARRSVSPSPPVTRRPVAPLLCIQLAAARPRLTS